MMVIAAECGITGDNDAVVAFGRTESIFGVVKEARMSGVVTRPINRCHHARQTN